MTLTTIQYGSLASSAVLNNNFTYLDNKITSTAESIMSSISSILSNIATINSNFNDLSEDTDDAIQAINTAVQELKTNTQLVINKSTMAPNWVGLQTVNSSSFTAASNGYLLGIISSQTGGSITVNSVAVPIRYSNNSDSIADMISIPLKKGDVVSSIPSFRSLYFLPAAEFELEED